MNIRSKLGLYKTERLEKPVHIATAGYDIHDVMTGMVCSNEDGSCFLIENQYPLFYIYGGCPLGAALDISTSCLCRLCANEPGTMSVRNYLFLDTETTGLSGGAGTVAFLVGVGFFETDHFTVRQYLMRDYDEEPAMLNELNKLLSRFDGLVTFNGKSFDWNLLLGRFISNRIKIHLKNPLHIDLLFPARKIWGQKLESCRLISLEENVLEEFRMDDIPGAIIPSVYFKYIEDRDASDMKRVIKHNEWDILSMVSLLVKMSAMLENPFVEVDSEYEMLGLGRIFEAGGEEDRTVHCFESCSKSENFFIKEAAVKRLTGIYKRNGDYQKALEHWEDMISAPGGIHLFPMVEMAKYYEHKEKNIPKALEIVEKAMQFSLHMGKEGNRYFSELHKRMDRLKKKAARLD